MMKAARKVLCVVLTLVLCFSTFTYGEALTPAESYEGALKDLNYYLTTFSNEEEEEIVSMEEINTAFKNLGSYKYANAFFQYSYILLALEQEDYRLANMFKAMLENIMEKNTNFNEYIISEEFVEEYPSIRPIEELLIYVDARTNEYSGNIQDAIEGYMLCSLFFDSAIRYMNLMGGDSETMYASAIQLFTAADYAGAYSLFTQLSEYDYEDSALYAELCYSMAVDLGIDLETGADKEWSEWLDSLPEGISEENAKIETKVLYRTSEKEYTTSSSASKDGWTLYDTSSKNNGYGAWSSWSTNNPGSNQNREVEDKTQYRYRTLETTTSASSSLSGWEKYDQTSSWGSYGSWSDWSTNSVSQSDSRKVETKTQYSYNTLQTYQDYSGWSDWSSWSTEKVTANSNMEVETKTQYAYYYWTCPKCGNHWHGYGFTCASWGGGCGKCELTKENTKKTTVWGDTPQSQMGFKDWHGTGWKYATYNGQRVFQFQNDPNKSRTVYRYRTRQLQTYYTVSDWSSYSDNCPSSYYDLRTRTLYRYCERTNNTTYYYRRWGAWSDWQDASVSKNGEKDVESRTVYRYRDAVKEDTYYFFRWKEWSDWIVADTVPEKTEEMNVETKTQYRYK